MTTIWICVQNITKYIKRHSTKTKSYRNLTVLQPTHRMPIAFKEYYWNMHRFMDGTQTSSKEILTNYVQMHESRTLPPSQHWKSTPKNCSIFWRILHSKSAEMVQSLLLKAMVKYVFAVKIFQSLWRKFTISMVRISRSICVEDQTWLSQCLYRPKSSHFSPI